jgi:hypothetical protein
MEIAGKESCRRNNHLIQEIALGFGNLLRIL